MVKLITITGLLLALNANGQFMFRRSHPLSARVLVTLADTGNASSYATAAFTCGSFRLVLALVITSDTINPAAASLTSLHGTWTMIANTNYDTTGTPLHRLSLWRLMNTNGTQSSTLTNTVSDAATGCIINVLEFAGINSNGTGGSAAVTNIVMGAADAGANPTITLAAIGHPSNGAYGNFGNDINGFAGTAINGWVEAVDNGFNTPATGGYNTFRLNTQSNVVAVTRAAADWAGVACEIKVFK